MSEIRLYHNPACSKSRAALELLQARDLDFKIVEYLEEPLSAAELEDLLGLLDDDPDRLVRRDKHFKELGLSAEGPLSASEVVGTLVQHPRLMERPVLVTGGHAAIGRPIENLIELLDR